MSVSAAAAWSPRFVAVRAAPIDSARPGGGGSVAACEAGVRRGAASRSVVTTLKAAAAAPAPRSTGSQTAAAGAATFTSAKTSTNVARAMPPAWRSLCLSASAIAAASGVGPLTVSANAATGEATREAATEAPFGGAVARAPLEEPAAGASAASVASAARASGKRSSGFFARSRVTSCSRSAGTSSRKLRSEGTGSLTCFLRSSLVVRATNGPRPVRRWNATAPAA